MNVCMISPQTVELMGGTRIEFISKKGEFAGCAVEIHFDTGEALRVSFTPGGGLIGVRRLTEQRGVDIKDTF